MFMLNHSGMGQYWGSLHPQAAMADLTREEAASLLRSLGGYPGLWSGGWAVRELANPAEIMSWWDDVHLNWHRRVSRLNVTDREAKRSVGLRR